MYIRSDVAFRGQTGLAMLNLSFVNPDPKRPFTVVDLEVSEGWDCDDPLWDGETKKRTFVV
jgi:hypothetical protein